MQAQRELIFINPKQHTLTASLPAVINVYKSPATGLPAPPAAPGRPPPRCKTARQAISYGTPCRPERHARPTASATGTCPRSAAAAPPRRFSLQKCAAPSKALPAPAIAALGVRAARALPNGGKACAAQAFFRTAGFAVSRKNTTFATPMTKPYHTIQRP